MKLWPLIFPSSIHARLTLWIGIVLGIALVSFTLGVYSMLARDLLNEVDWSLAERADQVNNAVRLSPGFPPGSSPRIAIPRPDTFTSADTFVQVVSLDGEVVGISQTWETLVSRWLVKIWHQPNPVANNTT